MTTVTRNQKIYFAAVGLLALWVGIWGFFIPEHVDKAIPWLVPPFHARFIGAIYFSAVVLMSGSMLAKHDAEVKVTTFIVALWTGMLFVISLFYLKEFDFSRGPVWFWFGAYILYPLIGFWFGWKRRTSHDEPGGAALPQWVQGYFFVQGTVLTLLSLALLFAPDFMVNIWPWKITRMLAQIYSGPFLAYGLGSLMTGRQHTWLEVRIMALASSVLTIGILLASIIHRTLFSISSLSIWVWFGGFSLAALFLGVTILRNMNAGNSK